MDNYPDPSLNVGTESTINCVGWYVLCVPTITNRQFNSAWHCARSMPMAYWYRCFFHSVKHPSFLRWGQNAPPYKFGDVVVLDKDYLSSNTLRLLQHASKYHWCNHKTYMTCDLTSLKLQTRPTRAKKVFEWLKCRKPSEEKLYRTYLTIKRTSSQMSNFWAR